MSNHLAARAGEGVVLVLSLSLSLSLSLGSDSLEAREPRNAVLSESHRSASGVHKLVVIERHPVAAARLATEGNVVRTIDYGGFKVLFVDDATMTLVADPSMKDLVRIRDDFDLISLNGWVVDTRVGEPADLPRDRVLDPGSSAWQLYVVQFVAPVRDEWLAALTGLGDVQVLSYLPHNAYLIRAGAPAWTRLAAEAGEPVGTIQWVGVYHPAYRISRELESTMADSTEVDVVVQLVDSPEGRVAAGRIRGAATTVYTQDEALGGVRNLRLRIPGARIGELAREPDVVWIEPLIPATPLDERQAQIVAGNVFVNESSEEQPAEPPVDGSCGYWTWLESKHLNCTAPHTRGCEDGAFNFIVDVRDTGFDNGDKANVPGEFKVLGSGSSRVEYAVNYLLSGTAADTGNPPEGHGTLVAATIAGYNTSDSDASRDSDLYRYGIGVAPSVRVGVIARIRIRGSLDGHRGRLHRPWQRLPRSDQQQLVG